MEKSSGFALAGPYSLNFHALKITGLILYDSLKVHLKGILSHPVQPQRDLAKKILKENIHGELVHAGQGHFKLMWISDFAMALKGLLKTTELDVVEKIIQNIIDVSYKNGQVRSCFYQNGSCDMPYSRADSFPWLIYSVDAYVNASGKKNLVEKNFDKLQALLSVFEQTHADEQGFIKKEFTGDWVDTIKRPSSTWNNILALHTYKVSNELGLKTSTDHKNFEFQLLKDRFIDDYLIDYKNSQLPSVDSAILAMYLESFDSEIRRKLAKWLDSNSTHLMKNYPIRASMGSYSRKMVPLLTRITSKNYHTTTEWQHLGLMYLNGLKKLGLSYAEKLERIERMINKYNNFIETFHEDGKPYMRILSCEYGFTMSAGQYLELTSN